METVYQKPVAMKDRVGVTINPMPETLSRELDLLRNLGKPPVFMRFHCHETAEKWDFSARVVRDLHAEGYPVSIALVQNRRAVTDPEHWKSFLFTVLNHVRGAVEWVEVGHAINRVKWGIWDFDEYRGLMDGVAEMASRFPEVKFMGPSVIDFEYPYVMAALKHLPPSLKFGALSHHLYVDRRGAPESMQGVFAAIDKFALAKAVSQWSGVCNDRVIVSEVSWPLKGTGVYSPVGSPYDSPGPRHNDPSVSEDDYANYMLRYLVIALCSGLIDRVYWWRLVARGFGLVDDTDAHRWRERPAYSFLKMFLATLGGSVFVRKPDARECLSSRELPLADGVHLFVFRQPNGGEVCLAYSSVGQVNAVLPFVYAEVRDAWGNRLPSESDRRTVPLTSRPVYVFTSVQPL